MDSFLKHIKTPQDIAHLSFDELDALAEELRNRIIQVLSVNGGHLASNLGTVELTIALHHVFNAPADKLLFDVSHQTYSHKLLTGRNDRFDRIRKYKGLCGFSHSGESEYDHFYAGHAGTALSLALGLVKNRDFFNRDEYVIPVIGDATLTCGMVLEALNNLPSHLKRFIVILNDNAMSISDNVGAISQILGRLINNPLIKKFYPDYGHKKKALSKVIEQQQIANAISQQKHPTPAPFFEQYGLHYSGPIDGHDIKKLVYELNTLKNVNGPCLLHVITHKGKGMPEAMKNPITHHGAKPFNPDSGKFLPNPSSRPTFPKVFGKFLLEMAQQDPKLMAVTPAMSFGSCLDSFKDAYPNRCIDVGIAEAHSVTFCGGIAYGNEVRVISSIYATFLQRAMDNLFHDVCLQDIPIVFAIDRAGLSPADGPTHHGIYDIGFLKTMPNMVICQPRNGQVLKELMQVCFDFKRPTAIRYPNMVTENNEDPKVNRQLGKGEVLVEEEGVLIVALGHMNQEAMELHKLFKQVGINSSVFDPIFVKPLDEKTLSRLLKTHKYLITIEEHSEQAGLSSSINQFLVQNQYSHIKVLNRGIPDVFLQQGTRKELLEEIGLTPKQIFESAIEHFKLKCNQMALI